MSTLNSDRAEVLEVFVWISGVLSAIVTVAYAGTKLGLGGVVLAGWAVVGSFLFLHRHFSRVDVEDKVSRKVIEELKLTLQAVHKAAAERKNDGCAWLADMTENKLTEYSKYRAPLKTK